MADWSKGVEAFQSGSDWRQRYRANKQLETARDQALERGEYGLEGMRATRKLRDPDTAGVLGALDPNSVSDWNGQLQDPFATRLMDWFRERKSKKQMRTKALDLGGEGAFGTSNPVGTGEEAPPTPYGEMGSIGNPQDDSLDPAAETFAYGDYADGGTVSDEEKIKRAEKWNRQNTRNARVEIAKETVKKIPGQVRDAASKADDAVGRFTSRADKGAGFMKKAGAGVKRLGAAGALAGTALTTGDTDTDQYRKRFGLEPSNADTGFFNDLGVRTLGAASDLGNALTFGAAGKFFRDSEEAPAQTGEPQGEEMLADAPPAGLGASEVQAYSGGGRRSSALPTEPAEEAVNFADIDIDPREVPDMKTNDWVKYRAQMMDAARQSGDQEAIGKVNDMVTEMQIKGFLNYGQQGFALQQAGNIKGAMAAYRAAFQYFPNGNDVEFGLHKGKGGRQHIVGVGVDEQTGKVIPGTQMVMDPERVTTLLENFKNPAAFRMWTKDWRDDQFKERQYREVTKPLAQGTLDYQATMGDARTVAAEAAAARAAGGGAGNGANMRNAENVFRERMDELGMTDPNKADYLASVMSQVKSRNPNVPDNTIVQVIMTADRDGTLKQRLARMGVGGGAGAGGAPAPAPRQAIPMDEGTAQDPEMSGLSPEEIEWANRPAQ
jgi:hypothetical protein